MQRVILAGIRRVQRFATDVVCKPNDSADLRFQKTLFVTATLVETPAAFLWGAIYLIFNEPVPASIPLSYGVITFANIALCRLTGWYRAFRLSQMTMTLLLPFLLMVSLGGYIPSSAVVLWSIVTPLGALVFTTRREAALWFAAFLGLVVLGAILQPIGREDNNLPFVLIIILFAMNVIGPSVVAFWLLHYFVGQKDRAYGLLHQEQEKSERLLLNVLPADIAAMLKDGPRRIAARFESASVLFADIVGSTALTVELVPERMVELLDEVFSYFDSLVEKYGLEKIRTIGDGYMVASGVPSPRLDHAHALARLALDMREYVQQSPVATSVNLQLRIGINSGPAVAGVIGQKKFQYDIWGDAVNTAARMESYGMPGRIQISKSTFELIKSDFVCVPRGVVEVKGKGNMETWFLESVAAK